MFNRGAIITFNVNTAVIVVICVFIIIRQVLTDMNILLT